MGTITDKDNRGHIYNILIRGNGNQVCVIRQDSPGLVIMNPVQWSLESRRRIFIRSKANEYAFAMISLSGESRGLLWLICCHLMENACVELGAKHTACSNTLQKKNYIDQHTFQACPCWSVLVWCWSSWLEQHCLAYAVFFSRYCDNVFEIRWYFKTILLLLLKRKPQFMDSEKTNQSIVLQCRIYCKKKGIILVTN